MENMLSKINVQSNRGVLVISDNVNLQTLEADTKRVLTNKRKKADVIVVVYPNGNIKNLKQL